MSFDKPIVLMDLDDTLFQTIRKIPNADSSGLFTGAVDEQMKANSFLTPKQMKLFSWLNNTSELIPVTARGTEQFSRVRLPFKSWSVTTYGAVILRPDGTIDETWKSIVEQELKPFMSELIMLKSIVDGIISELGIDAWSRINTEYKGLNVYLVMKHRDNSRLNELTDVINAISECISLKNFCVHKNDNNVAWIPKCIGKGVAVQYLMDRINPRGAKAVLGFGDSLSDASYFAHCDWWGTPARSQVSDALFLNCLESGMGKYNGV